MLSLSSQREMTEDEHISPSAFPFFYCTHITPIVLNNPTPTPKNLAGEYEQVWELEHT